MYVEAAAKPGHMRGISEATKLKQGLAGDPVTVGLEETKLSLTLRWKRGAKGSGDWTQHCPPAKGYNSGLSGNASR